MVGMIIAMLVGGSGSGVGGSLTPTDLCTRNLKTIRTIKGGSVGGVGELLIDPDRFRTPKLKNNPD